MQVVLNDFQYDASCTLTRYFQRLLPGFMMGLLLNCLPSTNCLSWNVKLSTETVHSNKSSKSTSTYFWYNCLSPQCRPPLQRIHKKGKRKSWMWAKFISKCAIEEEARLRLNSPPLKTTYTSNCANALTFPSPLGYSFSSCLSWSILFQFWKWLLPFISSLDRPTRSWSSEGP